MVSGFDVVVSPLPIAPQSEVDANRRSRLNSAHCSIFSGSIRNLLRSETAADHAQVDARFAALIGRGERGYREFLRLSWAAICPLEQALVDGNVEWILPDWKERSRTASLHADLAELR